jgi:hypothetical protein
VAFQGFNFWGNFEKSVENNLRFVAQINFVSLSDTSFYVVPYISGVGDVEPF